MKSKRLTKSAASGASHFVMNVTTSDVSWLALRKSAGTSCRPFAAKITADLSGVVASEPDLTGMPVAIASVVQALANDVRDILGTYGSTAKVGGSLHSGPGNGVHFGTHDRQRIIALRAKALGLLADSQVRLQMLEK